MQGRDVWMPTTQGCGPFIHTELAAKAVGGFEQRWNRIDLHFNRFALA